MLGTHNTTEHHPLRRYYRLPGHAVASFELRRDGTVTLARVTPNGPVNERRSLERMTRLAHSSLPMCSGAPGCGHDSRLGGAAMKGKTLMELEPGDCKYPSDTKRDGQWLFTCDQPVAYPDDPGVAPYCRKHLAASRPPVRPNRAEPTR